MIQIGKHINDGTTINVTATGDVAHNEVITISKRIAVAVTAASTGQVFAAHTEGVFLLPAKTGEAFAQGDELFWDGTVLSKTGTVRAGWCTQPKATADTTARVKIS